MNFIVKSFFVVKSKSKLSCVSAIYFYVGTNIIKENCNVEFYFNKTDIKPSVLDGGHEIVLTNWPNYKHMVCMINNSIPVNIPSYPYILLNSSILCNCDIKHENNFLLESLSACHNSSWNLVMYFTVNMAFVTYFDTLMDYLDVPILQNWVTHEQIFSYFFAITGV